MRRSVLAAGAAIATLAGAAPAHGQPQPVTFDATVTPARAGTPSRPRPTTLTFQITNPAANRTTASRVEIFLPRHARLSGRGFRFCSASRLDEDGPSACPRASGAGSGRATASLLTGATNFDFRVRVFIGGPSTLLLHLQDRTNTALQAVFPARVTRAGAGFGQKITIGIPATLQQPVPGAFSALTSIQARIRGRRGRRGLITTRGCPTDRNHDLRARLTFVPNPTPPALAVVPIDAEANCSR